jgi:antitoxin component of MazEF toxin-antitoxin module
MLRKRITTLGNSAALVLSRDLLKIMHLEIGDEVELSYQDNTLLVRPVQKQDIQEYIDETPFISPVKKTFYISAPLSFVGKVSMPPIDEEDLVDFHN